MMNDEFEQDDYRVSKETIQRVIRETNIPNSIKKHMEKIDKKPKDYKRILNDIYTELFRLGLSSNPMAYVKGVSDLIEQIEQELIE